MALTRVHIWSVGEVLTASDLNTEFNNPLLFPIQLISPTTGAINFNLQAHTNLVPAAITASSASAGQALVAVGGVTVWGNPSLTPVAVTSGQLIVGTSSGGFTTINQGTTGQVLVVTSSNTNAAFGVIPPSGGLTTGTLSTGTLLYISSSGVLATLPIGTTGQVLTVVSSLPAWANASAGGGASFAQIFMAGQAFGG